MKNTLIIFLLLLTLIIAACSTNQPNLAGRINGTPIPYEEYIASWRGHYANFWTLNNRAPGIDEKQKIIEQTWRDATAHVVLTDYFARYKITATQQEVLDSLKNNPPEYIRTSPRFSRNGAFDQKLFVQSLEYDNPENLQPLRQHYQTYLIPILKLQNALIDDKLLTRKEQKLIAKVLASQADIEWTVLDVNAFEPIILEADIKSYYLENQELFRLDPYYALNYIRIAVQPSAQDREFAIALADSLYWELITGESVEDVINKRQSYYPHLRYKASGFLRNSDLDEQTYQQLTALREGEFSAPLLRDGSLVILQLEQLTKSMSSFYTLHIPIQPGTATIEASRLMADRIRRLAESVGLNMAAEEMDLDLVKKPRLLPGEPWLEDRNALAAILQLIENSPAGTILPLTYSEELAAWFVLELAENKLNQLTPLAEVSSGIKNTLATQQKLDLATRMARQLLAGQAPPAFEPVLIMSMGTNIGSRLLEQDIQDVFYDLIRRYYQKDKAIYYILGDNVIIPNIISIKSPALPPPSYPEIRRFFVRSLPADWFNQWLEKEIKAARLVRYL